MRLWHQKLLDKLPRQQLLGQHRECCALRGKGYGQNHSTINYVWKYSPARLVAYHLRVMEEMENRGYNPNSNWLQVFYRGKNLGYRDYPEKISPEEVGKWTTKNPIYPEHDEKYLKECIKNLKEKECVCRYLEGVL